MMKLTSLRIEKFRAIRDAVIRIDSELALVGQNSAGKSSILRAINSFFNFEHERISFESGRHSYQRLATTTIEVGLSSVPDECKLPRADNKAKTVRARLRFKKNPIWQIFSNGKWLPAPPDLHDELGRFIRYVYVPLRRDHEVAGWGSAGLLREAVDAWLQHHTSKRDTISPKVAELGQSIKLRALNGLSKQLRKITPISGAFTFNLEYTRPPDYSVLLKDLALRVTENNTTVDLEDCGSGTQSMTALALYSYLAELKSSTYVLGIEEPEQNLHPQAQRELLSNLRLLPLQVLFTTHSTVMLDALNHHEVVLCRRATSTTRGIEIVTHQLPMSYWIDNNINVSRYYQFHRQRNSDFFFANFVILTEGTVDAEIIAMLLKKSNIDPASQGVSILSLDGVNSLPHAYHLLKTLKIDFATVVDKDYFLPYLNDDLESSRDTRGFPRYRKEFKKNTLLPSMIPNPDVRNKLLYLFHTNHSRAMDILEKHKVFCFKWCIEMDLINSNTACTKLYEQLKIPFVNRKVRTLLVDNKKNIKKFEVLLPIVGNLAPSNLPNSYKRLRKSLPTLINGSPQPRKRA